MIVHKFRKLISTLLSLALTSTMIPCGAANLVPFNGVKPVVTPSVPITKPVVEQKNSSDDFSIQSIGNKVDNILNSSNKTNSKKLLVGDDSGQCGSYATYTFTSATGELVIDGSGDMFSYCYNTNLPPWASYVDFITSIKIGGDITSIGTESFRYCCNLTSVIIEDSMHGRTLSIGGAAFFGCNSLTEINLPSRVIEAKDAFGTSLTHVTLNNDYCVTNFENIFRDYISVTDIVLGEKITKIDKSSFYGCSSLTSVAIPDSVTSIGEGAFSRCKALTSIAIPSAVTSIGKQAFYGCETLKSITVPDLVTSIGESAFSDCRALESITLGKSINSVGDYTFRLCNNLSSVVLNSDYCVKNFKTIFKDRDIHSIVLSGDITTIESDSLNNCSSLTELNLYADASIENGAFYGCTNLEHITLGTNNVVSRFNSIFDSLNNIKEIRISESVDSIPVSSFEGCASLTASIQIPDSVTNVGDNAFKGCSSLSIINLPSVKNIGNLAFEGCTGLNSLNMPIIENISEGAFRGCSGLTEINLPTSVNSIGNEAFFGCTNLEHITLSNNSTVSRFNSIFNSCKAQAEINIADGVTSIDDPSFKGCGWLNASILVPDTVVNIGANAFKDCSSLSTISLPSVKNIGTSAFEGCSGLNSITIPKIETICDNAFSGCSGLAEINLFDNIISIGKNAFCGCTGLTEINIPASVNNIGDFAFDGCIKMFNINVDASNGNYMSIEGILHSKDETKLIRCPEGKTGSVKFSDKLSLINPYAFSDCKNLDSISMNEGLNTISEYAFKGCTGLTSIDIPYSVSEIKENAFSGCTNIIFATLNNSYVLENFKNLIFPSNYDKFKSVTLGNNITEISNSAFSGCSNLNSVSIGNNIVSIGESAFSDCVALKTVSIPNKVEEINKLAFSNCKALNQVTVSGNVGFFGEGAFLNCVNLNKFIYNGTVPPRYDDKGISVFSNCPKLVNVSVPKDYEGDNFCGYKIDLVKQKNAKDWIVENIFWLAPAFTIISGIVAILTFPKAWNKFIDRCCCCCGCMQNCKFPEEIKNNVTPTNDHDQSSSVNDPLLGDIEA